MVLKFLIYEASLVLQCTLILFLILIATNLIKNVRRKLPPGPWSVPGLGYIPLLRKNTHLEMYKLSQKFGDIFSFALGERLIVVLSDPTLIREAFNQYEFTGKPMTPLYGMFKGFGVINTRGKMWKDERRFLHKKLIKLGMKRFGTGREQMEARIQTEVRHLLHSVMQEAGRPMDMDQYLTVLSSNVITSFLASTRYNVHDPIFQKHKEINGEGFQLFANLDMINYIWALKFLPSYQKDMKKLKANHGESMKYFKELIRDRRKTFKPSDEKDVLDAYMAIEHERQGEGSIENFDEQVAQVLCDLVSAGSESVKTTLSWILVYLLHRPDVLQRMKEEIDDHLGNDRLPSIDDQSHLVYCQATINEVMRRANVVPVAPNHATETDMTLNGFFIPKGSSVVALLYACHMCPKYWEDPEDFRPERFISETGRLYTPKAFIPFGKGLRVCLGDTMAQSEMFLLLTALVQNFDLENPPNTPLPSKEGVQGATLSPKDFKVCLRPRNERLPYLLQMDSKFNQPDIRLQSKDHSLQQSDGRLNHSHGKPHRQDSDQDQQEKKLNHHGTCHYHTDTNQQQGNSNLDQHDSNFQLSETNQHKPDTNTHQTDSSLHHTESFLHQPEVSLQQSVFNVHQPCLRQSTGGLHQTRSELPCIRAP